MLGSVCLCVLIGDRRTVAQEQEEWYHSKHEDESLEKGTSRTGKGS